MNEYVYRFLPESKSKKDFVLSLCPKSKGLQVSVSLCLLVFFALIVGSFARYTVLTPSLRNKQTNPTPTLHDHDTMMLLL